MAILNREQILSAQDLAHEDVEISEWGGIVRVRALTGAERDWFESQMFKEEKGERKITLDNLRAKLVALTLVDDKNNRLFTEKDVENLGKKNALVLDRIFNVAQRLSGMGQRELEGMVKNSEAAQ